MEKIIYITVLLVLSWSLLWVNRSLSRPNQMSKILKGRLCPRPWNLGCLTYGSSLDNKNTFNCNTIYAMTNFSVNIFWQFYVFIICRFSTSEKTTKEVRFITLISLCLSVACRWLNLILACICWFKVDLCITIISSITMSTI